MSELREIAEGLAVVERPLSFMGMELGARMCAFRFEDQSVLLHSPVRKEKTLADEVTAFGNVQWAVAPNAFHHLFVQEWATEGVELWGGEKVQEKRSDVTFKHTLGASEPTWPAELEVHVLASIPFSGESVWFHAPSKTLVVTDLVFHLTRDFPAITRAMLWMSGGYPKVKCTHLERVMMDREKGREDLERILDWDFERLVMAHGEIVEKGGKEALAKAYRWLQKAS